MKRIFIFLLCMALILTGTGCSHISTHTREKHPLSLHIAASFSNDLAAQTYQSLSTTFAERYGIQILDNSNLSSDAYVKQILNDFAAGKEPDVFYFPVDHAQTLIDNSQIVSLDEIRRRYPQYATTIQDEILEQTADTHGQNWCVPVLGSYQALFCNTKLFEIYGAPLPRTWSDLMQAVAIFKQYNVVPIAAGFLDNTQLWTDHLILSYGTQEHGVLPIERSDIPHTWNQALAQLPHLREKKAFPVNVTSLSHANAQTLFRTQKAAMILDSSNSISLLSSEDPVIALSVPCKAPASGEQHLIVDFSSGFFISRKAWENEQLRDAAVHFVMYMSSQEAVSHLVKSGGGYPALVRERLATITSDDPLSQSVLDLVATARLHTSLSKRLSRRAWSTVCSSAALLYQGYNSIDRVLDDIIKNNASPS